ncbi:uroporphyrinogen-III synthase [Virgibacillus xinjiangensis]|uniref:Uroporphyrinogen-III synthase n=1 Tax=Virgibacillus xinjiangensis TaxID=393090 RepID=A0ABV7CY56_9BACI
MNKLDGKKIGVAAARSAEAISSLVVNNGGSPEIFSIQGEQLLNEEVSRENVSELLNRSFDYVLLTTGIGAEALEKAAEQDGQLEDFIHKLRHSNLAVRGSKTLKWLKKHSLTPSIVAEDGTMQSLLNTLGQQTENGQHIFLQAYNQDDASLKEELEGLGLQVYLSKPYHYQPPESDTLSRLQMRIMDRTVDAVVFTSKTQVNNLFVGNSLERQLLEAFNQDVLAVAVGKVTAGKLKQYGVTDPFQPTDPKMGRMVVELADHYASLSHPRP